MVARKPFPSLPFIAEDLGAITEPVRQLDVPGMRMLLFAFDSSHDNPHLPQKHIENSESPTQETRHQHGERVVYGRNLS